MIGSKSKTSFTIDDLLCNNTADRRPTKTPKPSYNTINENTVRPEVHRYLQNGNRFPLFSEPIDHFNAFNFHHYPRLSAPHMDLPNTFNPSKFLT